MGPKRVWLLIESEELVKAYGGSLGSILGVEGSLRVQGLQWGCFSRGPGLWGLVFKMDVRVKCVEGFPGLGPELPGRLVDFT